MSKRFVSGCYIFSGNYGAGIIIVHIRISTFMYNGIIFELTFFTEVIVRKQKITAQFRVELRNI